MILSQSQIDSIKEPHRKVFAEEYGVSYAYFRKWVIDHMGDTMKDVKGYLDLYIRFYKKYCYHKKPFIEKYGITYPSFKCWVRRSKGLMMSDIDNLPVLVREYKNWKRRKRHEKRT